MNSPSELFARIYVDASDLDALTELAARTIGGTRDGHSVNAPRIRLDIRRNKDHELAEKAELPDGFLRFAHTVEVYPDETLDPQACLDSTSRLLSAFWSAGIPAVGTTDREEELLNRGGYRDESLPWPKPISLRDWPKLPCHTRVRLNTARHTAEGVGRHAVGTIIEVYDEAYEVAFTRPDGTDYAQLVVRPYEVDVDSD